MAMELRFDLSDKSTDDDRGDGSAKSSPRSFWERGSKTPLRLFLDHYARLTIILCPRILPRQDDDT